MRKGWEIKKMEEVATFQRGLTYSKKDEVEISSNIVLRANNVDFVSNKLDFTELRYISKNINIPKEKKVRKGSLIICTASGSKSHLGKVALIDDNYDYAFGGFMGQLTPSKELDSNYFFYVLTSDIYRRFISELSDGVNINNLKYDDLKHFSFAIPPLPEQKRIVSILDEAFAAIAKAKANAEQNFKNAKELFESYLQGVFENKGEGWEEKTLGEVANTNGRIGWKGLTAKEYTEEGPLFVSVHSLNYGEYVDFRDAFHISQKRYDESPEIMLKKDDILICKDGAGIGKLGIVPELPDVATINSSLLLIRCKKEIITKFLYYNLLSPLFQSIVQSRLSGATTPHLYQRDIVTFPISLPSLKTQQTTVKKLDALCTETKKLEAIYQQKINDLDELKKSMLQKAFSGELTAVPKEVIV